MTVKTETTISISMSEEVAAYVLSELEVILNLMEIKVKHLHALYNVLSEVHLKVPYSAEH